MSEVLRPGVLGGTAVVLCGGGDARGAGARCAGLGASVASLEADLLDEEAVTAATATLGTPGVLVCDAASAFAAAGGGTAGLRAAVDGSFNATRAVANAFWIDSDAPGRVVFLAPAPGDGEHASAAAAALENTARTLSIEWSRHTITTVTVRPTDGADDADVAELVAFLVSPAGAYYSGCALTPGAPASPPR